MLANGFAVGEDVYDINPEICFVSKTPSLDTEACEVFASTSGLHFHNGVRSISTVVFCNGATGVAMRKGPSFSIKRNGNPLAVVSQYFCTATNGGKPYYKAERENFVAPLGFLLEKIGFDFATYEELMLKSRQGG